VGTVGTTIIIKGRKVRLRETHDGDTASFKAALSKVSDDSRQLRQAAQREAKAPGHGYRKKRSPKNV
jgi:hypothetical protein